MFTNTHISITEDSLQQLHEIHEAIQAMREPATYGYANSNPLLRLQQCARMSASCPSLNDAPLPDLPYLDSHGSVGSSPLHMPNSRKGSGTYNNHTSYTYLYRYETVQTMQML